MSATKFHTHTKQQHMQNYCTIKTNNKNIEFYLKISDLGSNPDKVSRLVLLQNDRTGSGYHQAFYSTGG